MRIIEQSIRASCKSRFLPRSRTRRRISVQSFVMKNLVLSISAAVLLCGAIAIEPVIGYDDRIPAFDGGLDWLNSAPLSSKSLRGKVVLVNFWTYSCINSLRE